MSYPTGLPEDLELHHIVVNSWEPAVDSEQNVVLISIPSVKDPKLAPPGKHTLHAYLPATEPFAIWEGELSAHAALCCNRATHAKGYLSSSAASVFGMGGAINVGGSGIA